MNDDGSDGDRQYDVIELTSEDEAALDRAWSRVHTARQMPRGDNTPIAPDDAEEEAILDRASDVAGAREEAGWLASLTPGERSLYERLLGVYQRERDQQRAEAEAEATHAIAPLPPAEPVEDDDR